MRLGVGVVVVAIDSNDVVVIAVAVEKDASAPRYLVHQAQEVEPIAAKQVRCPFEDEYSGVRAIDVGRIVQRDVGDRPPVDDDFMTQFTGGARVPLDQQTASLILERPIDEDDSHDTRRPRQSANADTSS